MDTTTTRLTAAAGVSAAVAGAIFVGVQIGHPPMDLDHIVTTSSVVRQTAKAVMAVLAVVGIAGLYLRNRSRMGLVGHAGCALLTIGYLAMFAVQCIAGYVLPTIARSNPGYVTDVLDAAVGAEPAGDIGHLSELFLVSGLGFAFGGLLFGITLYRAGIRARWAATLLAVGTMSALALAALPESFNRPVAVPTGIALIGLGWSLLNDRVDRPPASNAAAPVLDAVDAR